MNISLSREMLQVEINGGVISLDLVSANECEPKLEADSLLITVMQNVTDGEVSCGECLISLDQAREVMDAIAIALGCFDSEGGSLPL